MMINVRMLPWKREKPKDIFNLPHPLLGLSKKYEKDYFSLSFAEFYAESRKVKTHVINLLRKSAINLRKSARKKRNLLDNP